MSSDELEALRQRVERDPGHPSFPLWVEWLRREGRLAEARRVAEAGIEDAPARAEGRAALALVWLDLGDEPAARDALRDGIESLPGAEVLRGERPADSEAAPAEGAFAQELEADEIEQAFGEAESSPELMMSANEIAERALRQAMGHLAEPAESDAVHLDIAEMEMDLGPDAAVETDAAFAPEPSMSLPMAEMDEGRRARVLDTLERWLQNIRRVQ